MKVRTKAVANPEAALAKVCGRVQRVFFASPRFTAGKLETKSGDLVSFAGALMVREQDSVILYGAWDKHPQFGRQLKVTNFEFDQKMGSDGLAHYLASHPAMKGIGPAKAKRIAEAFGDDFDRVVDAEPERIAEVARVPLASVQIVREEWLRRRTLNAALTWLSSWELTHHQMMSLIDRFGNGVVTALKTDPYLLVREVPGFGFKKVDLIARKMGVPKEDPSRIRAGTVQCVAERLDQGDCWVDYQNLLDLSNELLVMDVTDSRDRIERELDAVIEDKKLECISLGGRFLVALPHIYAMERDLAGRFSEVLPNPHFTGEDHEALAAAFPLLNSAQRRALVAAMKHSVVLVSGAAGSGKSFLIGALTRAYEERDKKVILAAPTGKAAKRMEQVTGREAFTIHRLLGYSGSNYAKGPDDPIEADVVIVDEVSMVDVSLAWHLLEAIDSEKTCVVLVGDHHQLPPVGAGNVLRDLIERRPIPTVILDHVVRQAGVLRENSIAVLDGLVRPTAEVEGDGLYPWVVQNGLGEVTQAQAYIGHLFEEVLTEQLGFDLLTEVQVLTPTRKGPLGTEALNAELQRLVQRKLWHVNVPTLRPGWRPALLEHDRVIQTKNNYDLDVMNGAIGVVSSVGPRRGELAVLFEDGREVEYTIETVKELQLAYALTAHKYQGSEIPCAVVVCHKSHSFMHHRNWLYTAVTRARKTVIVVGDLWGMRNCAGKEQVERRKTFLSVLDLPAGPPAR